MIGTWNYFEPRELTPKSGILVVACRLNADKSIIYWAVNGQEGLEPIKIIASMEE